MVVKRKIFCETALGGRWGELCTGIRPLDLASDQPGPWAFLMLHFPHEVWERVVESLLMTLQLTVESRIDRTVNAMGLS